MFAFSHEAYISNAGGHERPSIGLHSDLSRCGLTVTLYIIRLWPPKAVGSGLGEQELYLIFLCNVSNTFPGSDEAQMFSCHSMVKWVDGWKGG